MDARVLGAIATAALTVVLASQCLFVVRETDLAINVQLGSLKCSPGS